MNKKLSKLFNSFIIWIGIFFALAISVLTLFLTTYILDYGQQSMSIEFAPFIVLGVIAVFVIFAAKPLTRRLEKINIKKLSIIVLLWGLITSLIWIFIADVFPMWDSLDLVDAARAFTNNPSPFSGGKWSAGVGSYMERFPFQTPIVALILLCIRFAGSNYLMLFQIINCLACAFAMYFIVKLTDALFKNKLATALSAILVMLFFPMILYCTFIYGNIICLPFAIAAWYFQKKAMDFHKENKVFAKYLVLSVLCAAASAFFKSTMIVVAISSAVVWVVWGIDQRKKLITFIVAAVVIIVSKFCILPFNLILSSHLDSGIDLNNGNPMVSWVAMGIGAGKEYEADVYHDESARDDTNIAGYFDGFIWIHPDEDYSPEKISQTSKEYINKRIEHYKSDPGLAIEYFARKIAIEWTEPTYESILASNWCIGAGEDGYPMCEREYTALARSFYYGKANAVLVFLMDVSQTILAVGLLSCLISLRKKLKIEQLAPLICILGGAFIYLLWENKTQYMMPFYLFMIPYAGIGTIAITEKFKSIIGKVWKRH